MTARQTTRAPKLHVADGYEICIEPRTGAAMLRITGTPITHSFDEAVEFGIVTLVGFEHKTTKRATGRSR